MLTCGLPKENAMSPESTSAPAVPTEPRGLAKYLDRAVEVLGDYGILPKDDEQPELIRLLDEVRPVDEARVLSIAKTVKYMSAFNAMVRDNVQDINDRQPLPRRSPRCSIRSARTRSG